MIISPDDETNGRNVIPRLRDFKTTLLLGELKSVASRTATLVEIPESALDDLISDWNEHRSLAFAADLVGSGFSLGRSEEIREAANFILEGDSSTELQKRIARQSVDPEFCSAIVTTPENISSKDLINLSREQVRNHRRNLGFSFRNPIRLVELAREYATLGSIAKAVRTMNVAVALAPANRYVLRSAARLYVHAGELDRAHHILKSAPSLRSDPWLLAAEIAVADKRGQTSHNIKGALLRVNDTNLDPFDLTELTSAIATLEMENANSKGARKLFRRAMQKPTENSIAQAEWVSRNIDKLGIEIRQFDVPRNYEALAWDHYGNKRLSDAIAQGKNWILDQPFAVPPVLFTGIVTAHAEDLNASESIYEFGLRANPENTILRNNYAYILASNDKPELAADELARIDRAGLSLEDSITITATEGLIQFRTGHILEGRTLYKTAIAIAQAKEKPVYALRATMFLAREEINAKTEFAFEALENAEKFAANFKLNWEATSTLQKMREAIDSRPELFPEQSFGDGDDKEVARAILSNHILRL